MKEDTPIIQQWKEIKQTYPNIIVFYRVGDFYEMFYEDAKKASRLLDIILTKRKNKTENVPMAGVPHHSSTQYINRLLAFGETIAICEQIGDAEKNGLFKRSVVRVLTPGTLIEEEFLNSDKENILASIAYEHKTEMFGVACIEISTGRVSLYDSKPEELESILEKVSPSEIISTIQDFDIVENNLNDADIKYLKGNYSSLLRSKRIVESKLRIQSINSLGLDKNMPCLLSLNLGIDYLEEKLLITNFKFKSFSYGNSNEEIKIDKNSIKNLEINETLSGDKECSLFGIINHCSTAMGSRNLKRWINNPTTNLDIVNRRLDAIEELQRKNFDKTNILEEIVDIERIIGRLILDSSTPKDISNLNLFLQSISNILDNISHINSNLFTDFKNACDDDIVALRELLDRAINTDLSHSFNGEEIIKEGYDSDLDSLRELVKNNSKSIIKFEKSEIEKTQIQKLKISFNSNIGFYIEIPKSKTNLIPESYIRKQSLKNSERFTTSELMDFEEKIFSSKAKLNLLEKKIFKEICEKVLNIEEKITLIVNLICEIDCVFSLYLISKKYNLVRPSFNTSKTIDIKSGRSIVLEKNHKNVISNDLLMSEKKTFLITGPNMGGKSTYMRQNATIIILAYMGSFVPAKSCNLPFIDKIFTRIGSSDRIHEGYSTFMVEMIEAAYILNNATNDSFVLMDEVGRGTSNEDGFSIAWAILSKISKDINSYNLFSTHYSKLSEIESTHQNVENYSFDATLLNDDIEFNHKIKKGVTHNSYGISVAKKAGLPEDLILLAKNKMLELK